MFRERYFNLFLVILVISTTSIYSQQLQNIRGKVINTFSKLPIENATVTIHVDQNEFQKAYTNSKGEYLFVEVPLGIYTVSFAHIEYESYVFPAVELYSSREMVIDVELSQRVNQLTDLVISVNKDRSVNNNDMATVSTKTIYTQDMAKIAGSLDDPIRVAGTLPGVTADAAFSENFISIRGNSPRGLKYTIEGVELPNPNHFARIGSSGGTFTIFSMYLIDKSDFFTGAFPAEYSDALSGIFDVNFRKGNTTKPIFAIKAGTLGLDFSAEGPMSKNKNSSYIVNYRYAVVGLARLIGYPTQPTYHDLSFNLNYALPKGNLKVFGMAGSSDRKRIAIADSSIWEGDVDRFNLVLHSETVTLGSTYEHIISEKSRLKATVLGSYINQVDNRKYLLDDYTEIVRNINQYKALPISASLQHNYKFGLRHYNKTGVSINHTQHNWDVMKYNFETNQVDTNVTGLGQSNTVKAFTQSKFNINDKWVMNIGLSYLYYDVNKEQSLEPRVGISYTNNKKQKFSLAVGKHSQIEHFATYMYKQRDTLGRVSFPNQNLQFIKAYHYIVGFKTKLFKNHHFSAEAYYQQLFDVPIAYEGTYSIINISELEDLRPLTNDGKGYNYGLDVGLERFSSKGLYYMINVSYFRSHYLAADNVWRSTEFDQQFNIRFLAGKEYIVGEKKDQKNYLGWNTNLAYVGGRPYTPIDIDASILAYETIYDEARAFSLREDNLLFLDVTFTYKKNKPNRTAIWSLQIKNIFSNGNAIYREYDRVLGKEVTVASSSFFPNLSYKIEF
jgi:hypothetical protein